ncbi:hypothetical protein [Bacillus altitudinis]|uniref:hypothetical protein n=1 Tax=Bacillus altitudinis TaxID=293387 RepID=UPI000AD4F32F|nr:hypothetical protein [Bacillus altitudinis]MCI9885912.1 hypothetical protein [Bacillus altitudinis]
MTAQKKPMTSSPAQRVDKPSHSLSVLRSGAHECQIRSAPVLVLSRAAKVFYHAEKKTKG